jgi:hypothetical protein
VIESNCGVSERFQLSSEEHVKGAIPVLVLPSRSHIKLFPASRREKGCTRGLIGKPCNPDRGCGTSAIAARANVTAAESLMDQAETILARAIESVDSIIVCLYPSRGSATTFATVPAKSELMHCSKKT